MSDTAGGVSPGAESGLHRVLKPRHLSMIASGGSIGTGLFLTSGASVATAVVRYEDMDVRPLQVA